MRTILADRYYFVLMSLAAGFVLWANYDEQTMTGILPYYRDFARVISHGFDPAAATERGLPTFPMWGYGWLMLITENRLALMVFQNILAILTVWFTIRFLKQRLGQDDIAIDVFKAVILVCLPWYAFHSALWPYSIAANAFAISALLYAESCEGLDRGLPAILWSGLLFGLALNFRSDYIMLPFVLAAGVTIFSRAARTATAIKSAMWLLAIFAMLIPWALYTKHVTGHYLWRSTNAGHVLFVGLGQLPDNKWGITSRDDDPTMRHIIDQRLGVDRSSLEYEGDRILKEEFTARVLGDPQEYLRKCAYGVRLVLTLGFYPGGFFDRYCSRFHDALKEFMASPTAFVDTYGWPSWRFGLMSVSRGEGMLLLWISYLLLPLTLIRAVRKIDLLCLIIVLSIGYQTAVGIFAYSLPGYASNMLLFHVINIGLGLSFLCGYYCKREVFLPESHGQNGRGDTH